MEIEIKTNDTPLEVGVEKAGPQGLSAYQVAVKNGFIGTEQEWLDSLVGEKGDKGDKGDTGEQGIQGERGLQGEQGIQGEKGEKGDKGDTGEKGADGVNGTNGRDGYVQYTAGDNITIDENNVISATGGDLSNYYTKAEINNINLPTYTFTASSFGWSSGTYTLPSLDRTNLANIINDAKTRGFEAIGIYIKDGSVEIPILTMPSSQYYYNIQDNPTTLSYNGSLSTGSGNFRTITLYAQVRWSNNVATITSGRLTTTYNEFLNKNNTTSFIPTGDYNPATKKYVDDSIANSSSSNYLGYIEDFTSDNRLDVTNLQKGTYAIGASQRASAQILYLQVTTDGQTSTYDLEINRNSLIIDSMFYLTVKNPVSTIEAYDEIFSVYFLEMSASSTKSLVNKKYTIGYNPTTKALAFISLGTATINIATSDTSQIITGAKTFNTLPQTSVVPANDNDMVNKKYVDDQIGNINTILATLTTPGGNS